MESVEALKRIELSIDVKDIDGNIISGPHKFHFIFGIGTIGLTPFECLLEGKKQGDQLQIRFNKHELTHLFGHIHPPFLVKDIKTHNIISLSVNILSISSPEQRELIHALAEIANCGDHSCCC